MSNYKEWNFGEKTIDLLVGGTPCQSFSVAGLRKGLEDPRGNLALIYVGILDKFRPKWFIWENVPGVLSSSQGKDFGSFLGAVGELGYGFSYRVLDAQNFGVPQRRRRVFVVGHLGDWKPAAEVLFEPESLSRHIEESRKKRKDTPRDTTLGIDTSGPLAARDYKDMGTDGLNKTSAKMIPEQTDALLARDYKGLNSDSLASKAIVEVFENHPSDSRVKEMGDTCQTVTSTWGSGGGNIPFVINKPVAHMFKIRGGSPVETGTQGGTPGKQAGKGYLGQDEKTYTINTTQDQYLLPPIALAENTIGRQPLNGGNGNGFTENGPMYTLNATGVHGVSNQMAVRKLTPIECERLQGFPDDYTNIKENCPDGHRYKAMGNSMAVPVMKWIGERIKNMEE
jgi:DNA (cytosine-5)-methyltransferase 1